MGFEKSMDKTRRGFEESFQEAAFYNKQTADETHLKMLLELVYPNKGDTILDLGTGSGYMAFAIADYETDCKVIGIDIVADTLERNRQRALAEGYSNLEFTAYDGIVFPFEDNSFDTIVTRYALHHFPNLKVSFGEMHRVLKKGGKLVISDPTPNQSDAARFVDCFMQKKADGHIKFYTYEEFDGMLKEAGFEFVSKQDSVIRFPRKNPEEYEDLLRQYDQKTLEEYEINITGDEIWIKENVLNMVYQKHNEHLNGFYHQMNIHKDTKWARDIIALQEDDGKWGCFHSLSQRYNSPITTEQAIRRLRVLGYTIEDECIQKAVNYMDDCLTGKKEIPDRREVIHDWDIYTSLMLSTWIRIFTKDNTVANAVAGKWAEIVSAAFAQGQYNHEEYCKAYQDIMGLKPRGGRLVDFVHFYPVSLLVDCLDEKIEPLFLEYVLNKETGMYYVYDGRLYDLPQVFQGREASCYLGAIELLVRYKTGKDKLRFVAEWLEENRNENGRWDMGSSVNDKVYFPLSDSWRKKEVREADCTERIMRLTDSCM